MFLKYNEIVSLQFDSFLFDVLHIQNVNTVICNI